MIVNFNIGILGHVDSGKTTLAKALSTIPSTAAFDKNPQSQIRGITLDLGFSALLLDIPENLQSENTKIDDKLQLTFVDCPGHASLIRIIIGGAQIIDMMILVVDAQKGLQTQTAECLVIGELTCKKLIIAINKIDLLANEGRENILDKLETKIRKVLGTTTFGNMVPIFRISANDPESVKTFIGNIQPHLFIPLRNSSLPLVFSVDHCFAIRGQGTICTGTILQGSISVNDVVEIPALKEQKKVKSIQMFKKSVKSAQQGDRIGLCVTQFNSALMERGLITKPNLVRPIYGAVMKLNKIKYYKNSIKSKSKFHMTMGHETVMANIIIFKRLSSNSTGKFDIKEDYEFVEEISKDELINDVTTFVLCEFETAPLAMAEDLVIASKLDMETNSNHCRIAFWGYLDWILLSLDTKTEALSNLKIYKNKLKESHIQRVVNENEIIVQNLFKKQCNRDLYIGKRISLSTGEEGFIENTFGQTSKVRIRLPNGLKPETLNTLNTKLNDVTVYLKYKKYIFNKQIGFVQ